MLQIGTVWNWPAPIRKGLAMSRLGIELDRNFASVPLGRYKSAASNASAKASRVDWILFSLCALVLAVVGTEVATDLLLFAR